MMLCGVSPTWFAPLFVHLLLTTAEALQSQQQASGHRHVVPLHRQRVPVRNEDDVLSFKSVYFGNIFVGAPEVQTFTVIFDTGSGHLILPSVACETESCLVHNRYNPEFSDLGTPINNDGVLVEPGAAREQVTIAFGTGEITGQFAHDRLCLSTTSKPNFPNTTEVPSNDFDLPSDEAGCFSMRIVTATKMSHEPFASFSFDGVLGLGFDSLALAPEFSFFNMLSTHGNLAHRSFGIFLADSDDDFSEISFGGPNPERVSSELAWANVVMPEHGHWLVQITAIRVGGRTLDFCADGQCRAVIDSGTSTIAVPSSISGELFDELEGSLKAPSPSESGVTDCKKAIGELLEFDIEGAKLVLGPGDYARPSVQMSEQDGDEEEDAALAALEGQAPKVLDGLEAAVPLKEAKCHPTLMPMDLPEPLGPKLFILGEPVLRKYYTVYDWEHQRVGFGLANHEINGKDLDRDVVDGTATKQPLLTIV